MAAWSRSEMPRFPDLQLFQLPGSREPSQPDESAAADSLAADQPPTRPHPHSLYTLSLYLF